MIVLYSIGCPKCAVLKKKLDDAGIGYLTVSDEKTIVEAGIDTVPVLEVEGTRLGFSAAIQWVNKQSVGE